MWVYRVLSKPCTVMHLSLKHALSNDFVHKYIVNINRCKTTFRKGSIDQGTGVLLIEHVLR